MNTSDHVLQTPRGHLVISAADSLAPQASALMEHLAQNAELRAGDTVRYGWGVFRTVAEPGGLRLLAPTYDTGPQLEFTSDATLALSIHADQLATLSRAGAEPTECAFDDRIVVEQRAAQAGHVYAERQQTQPGDSGWFLGIFGCGSPVGVEGLASYATYQLARLQPSLMRLLALPVGTIAVIKGDTVERVIGSDQKTLIDGPW